MPSTKKKVKKKATKKAPAKKKMAYALPSTFDPFDSKNIEYDDYDGVNVIGFRMCRENNPDNAYGDAVFHFNGKNLVGSKGGSCGDSAIVAQNVAEMDGLIKSLQTLRNVMNGDMVITISGGKVLTSFAPKKKTTKKKTTKKTARKKTSTKK